MKQVQPYVRDKGVRPKKITFSGHLASATQNRVLNPGCVPY